MFLIKLWLRLTVVLVPRAVKAAQKTNLHGPSWLRRTSFYASWVSVQPVARRITLALLFLLFLILFVSYSGGA